MVGKLMRFALQSCIKAPLVYDILRMDRILDRYRKIESFQGFLRCEMDFAHPHVQTSPFQEVVMGGCLTRATVKLVQRASAGNCAGNTCKTPPFAAFLA